MSELSVFNFDSHAIRTALDEATGEPLFVGKDVCEVLGYANPSDAMNLHCKGVAKRYPLQTPGGVQEMRALREPDLYRLVIGSNLPAAEKFEAWVFEEVLPSIRKTGKYAVQQAKQVRYTDAQWRELSAVVAEIEKIAATAGFTAEKRLSYTRGTLKNLGLQELVDAMPLQHEEDLPSNLRKLLPTQPKQPSNEQIALDLANLADKLNLSDSARLALAKITILADRQAQMSPEHQTKATGVAYDRQHGQWVVTGIYSYLGMFDTKEEAVQAREEEKQAAKYERKLPA